MAFFLVEFLLSKPCRGLSFTWYTIQMSSAPCKRKSTIPLEKVAFQPGKINQHYRIARQSFTRSFGYPQPSLLHRHTFWQNIKINGYTLPKGAWVLLGLCTVNWDSSIFPEPEKFNPGRFIDDSGQLFGFEKVYASYSMGNNLFMIEKESFKTACNFPLAVCVFSISASCYAGPRSCAAQALAEIELFLFITSVIQRYNIANEPGKPMPSLEGTYKGAHIPSPYNLCLKHRL